MPHRNKWWILFVTTSATALVFLDQTVMPVALPAIQRQFFLSDVALLWVVNVYLLTVMALLLIGGRLADLFGKKPVYLLGLSLFALASVLGALSSSSKTLLLARVIQGAGAALTLPATAALLIYTFPPHLRARAIGINTGISAIFLALGPVVGGVFTEYLSWRMIFWINLPIIAFAIIMCLWLVKIERRKHEESFHFLGALSVVVSVVSFVVAVMEGPTVGWASPLIITLLVIAPIFAVLFVFLSLKEEHPLIDFKVFLIRPFSGAILAIYLTQVMIAVSVFWAIYFQNQMGYSPAKTGFIIVIATLPVFIAAPLGGYLADRWGAKLPMTIGFSILIFALVWVGFVGLKKSISFLAPGLLGFGMGIPMIFSPAIALALSHVPTAKLGSSSAITTAARQLAATTGIALMTAVFQTTLQETASYPHAFTAVSLLASIFAVAGLASARFVIPNNGSLHQ